MASLRLRAVAFLFAAFVVSCMADDATAKPSQQCSQDSDDCGSDRSLLLQLPGLHVDASALDAEYTSSQLAVNRGDAVPDWRTAQHELLKDIKMKTNSEGDLDAFVSSVALDGIIVLMLVVFFCVVYRRYPYVYTDNILKGTAPEIPDTYFGWIGASWNLSSEQIEQTGGLDAAMFMVFVQLALRVLLSIGVPMVVILCPLHAFAGGHNAAHDKLSQLGMGNVVAGEGARWVYWVHALFVWLVVVLTQRAIFEAQALFLERRNRWLRQMPKPRCTTVLVEGIPPDCCSDDALKAEFCKLFPGDKVASAYIVRNTSNLVSAVERYNSAEQGLSEANFQWEALGSTATIRPQCRDWAFGKMVDKIDFYKEKRDLEATEVAVERKLLVDATWNGLEVFSNNGFVTFHTERDAAVALCLKVRANENTFMMSTPPDPADVQYCDLYTNENTLNVKALLGYGCLIGTFFAFTPIILAISSIVNLTALRKSIPLVDQLIVAFPMAQRLLEGVLASAALTLFMSFLPTIFMLVFDNFFQLKAGRWAQHRLQIWYFWFQIIFVLLITAVGSSLWDTMLTLVNHPTMIFGLLADRLPSTTHFYLNYMVMQWVVHGMNLTRYISLSKFKALCLVCEEPRAKELSEPEDQDYYGMGARSARFTMNLVIALVYCSLCPIITVFTGINFAICRVVYGYLLVFAEGRKPDLGGHFWVTQLKHVQYGLFIYVMLMVGVLSSRAATLGPTVVTAPALVYLARSYLRFHSQFQWEFMPFEEYTKENKEQWEASRDATRESYEQVELTEPSLVLEKN